VAVNVSGRFCFHKARKFKLETVYFDTQPMNLGFASEKDAEVLSQNIFQSPQKDLFLGLVCFGPGNGL